MAAQDESSPIRLAVQVDDDGQRAWLRCTDPDNPEPLTLDEIVSALQSAQVQITDAVHASCQEYVAAFDQAEDKSQPFLIAEGTPLTEGKDGEFNWHESFEKKAHDWLDDVPADYYTFNTIVTVETDMVLGTLVPAQPGREGVDVRGTPLRPAKCGADIQLDTTVRPSDEDPSVILASVAGKVVLEDASLSINEVFEVKGDVDYECGHIDSSVDVSVAGTVLDNFEVKSKKSIRIRGAIQAARIEAVEDVQVRGGILGRQKGTVRAGGKIVAKFAEDADLRATDDIKLTSEVMNSRLHTCGHLLAANGAIIGGDIYARESVESRALGSDGCVVTRIAVGIDPEVLREAQEITESLEPKRQTVERIREGIQPLMADLKRLTPAQKEKATKLLLMAEAILTEIKEAEESREKMLEESKPEGNPFVLVSKLIYPRVRIRIGPRHIVFEQECKGPVRIEQRKIKGVTEFVAVNQSTGSITILTSAIVVEEEPEAKQEAEAVQGPIG